MASDRWPVGMRSKPKGFPKLILYRDPTVKRDNGLMVVVFYINGSRLAFLEGCNIFGLAYKALKNIQRKQISEESCRLMLKAVAMVSHKGQRHTIVLI
ncbi:hypothetical protein M0R45_026623 [Rubus argutus]|uniref:Uncharacterized protein n=1 Tax=Rubus argutus TaxID=59490 RepID=A0AAW1WXZ7_RUBAR